MILASEFAVSAQARLSDFSTSEAERGSFVVTERCRSTSRLGGLDEAPFELGLQKRHGTKRVRGALIAQFAANEAETFANAVELIYPHVDGVDLNCGTCPLPYYYYYYSNFIKNVMLISSRHFFCSYYCI